MRNTCAVCCILLLLCATSSLAQTALEYYQRGTELYRQKQYEEAADLFRKATARNNKFAEAYFMYACCCMHNPTMKNKQRAEESLLRARRLEQDSTKYLWQLAHLYRQRAFHMPTEMVLYERIVKEAPDDRRALMELANIYRLQTEDMFARTFETDDYFVRYHSGIISGKKEGRGPQYRKPRLSGKQKKLIEMAERMLEEDPRDLRAVSQIAFVYLTLDNYDGLRATGEELLADDPENLPAHLLLGVYYTEERDYVAANRHFQAALALMGSGFLNVFEDFTLAEFDPRSKFAPVFREFDPAAADEYWARHDPLKVTPYNERRIEHYARVAEAYFRFSDYRQYGWAYAWQNARGLMWIRYGKPLEATERLDGNYRRLQYWRYGDFTVVFEKRHDSKELGYTLRGDSGKGLRTYYRFRAPGNVLSAETHTMSFRGPDSTSTVLFMTGMPDPAADKERTNAKLRHGLFLVDSTVSHAFLDTFSFMPPDKDHPYHGHMFMHQKRQVTPGLYALRTELFDESTGNIGHENRAALIADYSGDSLAVSDLLVSPWLGLRGTGSAVSLDNLAIQPNPLFVFTKTQPINLYFEIYNLTLRDGRAKYLLEYRIDPMEDETLLQRTLNVFRERPKDKVAVQSEATCSTQQDNRLIRIEHNIGRTGLFRLYVRIMDVTAGTECERWIYFTITGG